jgi:hypothetical protein
VPLILLFFYLCKKIGNDLKISNMSNEITKHPDLIKKEGIIKDLQKQLKKKQTTLKSLKTRLQNMQTSVEDISRKVQTMVMDKLAQIDKLRTEIAELAKQLKKSKNIGKGDKEALMAIAEDMSGNDEMFGSSYGEYKEHKEKMESGNFDFDEEHRAKFQNMFGAFQVKPPETEQRNIRKVFLKLSQKFHPDLAKNKKEEEDFHKMMLQINEAYQQNDIHTLLELERLYLMESFDFDSNAITIDVLDKEIERLERDIEFISNQVDRTSLEVKSLRQSEIGEMLTATNKAEKEGEGFEAMAAEHDEMIAVFTQMRDALKDSVEIDGVSPKIVEMISGGEFGAPMEEDTEDLEAMMMEMIAGGKEPNPEDLLEFLGKVTAQSRGDFEEDDDDFDMEDLFDMEEEEYEENKNPRFPIGSSVRVNSDRRSNLGEETSLKGWEGRIAAAYFDEDGDAMYMVEFDSQTIKQMPIDLIKEAIEFGSDFHECEFLEKEIIPAQARDKKVQAMAAYRKRFHEFKWAEQEFPEQGQRIKKIMLNNVSISDEKNWELYLKKHLKFPFSAQTRGVYALSGIPEGHGCQVFGVEFFDPENGFIMSTKPKGSKHRVSHPLVDLGVVNGRKKMEEVLDDYNAWGEEVLEV